MTANEVEICVARHFGWRQNIIVPNISWGFGLRYEADMVILRPSGWAMEVEIKVARSDIAADLKKHCFHNSNMFRQLWFALPEEISDDYRIPQNAGILAMVKHDWKHAVTRFAKVVRPAKLNPLARKLTNDETKKLLELGVMRIWSLKEHIIGINNRQQL